MVISEIWVAWVWNIHLKRKNEITKLGKKNTKTYPRNCTNFSISVLFSSHFNVLYLHIYSVISSYEVHFALHKIFDIKIQRTFINSFRVDLKVKFVESLKVLLHRKNSVTTWIKHWSLQQQSAQSIQKI